jgi:hypothetical protein
MKISGGEILLTRECICKIVTAQVSICIFSFFFSINFYRVNLIDTCIQVDVASDFYLLYISYKSKLSKIKKNEQVIS